LQTYQVSRISAPPRALTLALTKTGGISRICHSIVQTKLRKQQCLTDRCCRTDQWPHPSRLSINTQVWRWLPEVYETM